MLPAINIEKMGYVQREGYGIGGHWQSKPLWVATVEMGGHVVNYSQHTGESKWYADSHFGPKGEPYFCHGEGSRCTAKRVATGPVEEALNARKADLPQEPVKRGQVEPLEGW